MSAAVLPEFIEPEKCSSFRSNSCALFSVGSIATDGVSSKNFRNRLTEMHANRFLDLGKLENVELSDQSAARKTDDGYQDKGCPC